MEISLQEVLSPAAGYEMWDYLVYIIFALSLIGLIVSGAETNPMLSIFMAIVMVGAIIEKTYALGYIFGPSGQTHDFYVQEHLNQFWSMLIRAAMFAFSIITVVQAKKGATRGVAILLTLLTLAYGLGRWFDSEYQNLGIYIITKPHAVVAQGSVGLLVIWESASRSYRHWRRRIDRC